MKYTLSDGRVGVIHGDQKIAKNYYIESLKLKRVRTLGTKAGKVGSGIKSLGGTCKVDKAHLQLEKRSKIEGSEGMPSRDTYIVVVYFSFFTIIYLFCC